MRKLKRVVRDLPEFVKDVTADWYALKIFVNGVERFVADWTNGAGEFAIVDHGLRCDFFLWFFWVEFLEKNKWQNEGKFETWRWVNFLREGKVKKLKFLPKKGKVQNKLVIIESNDKNNENNNGFENNCRPIGNEWMNGLIGLSFRWEQFCLCFSIRKKYNVFRNLHRFVVILT